MSWDPNIENEALRWSWERHEADMLDSYMIAAVEDPRIHCQSILTRALIADSLWPGEFTDLINAEQRFGAVMTWLLQQYQSGILPADLYEQVVDQKCPVFVAETHYWLPQQSTVRDYITLSPGKLNDALAQLALRHHDRIMLRNRDIITANLAAATHWIDARDYVSWTPPRGGLLALLKYDLPIPSLELADKLALEHSVMLAPGSAFGYEHHLRLGIGQRPDIFAAGLVEAGRCLDALPK